jgi:dTDP-4-amino-4,6-dideoxygalactose transaminase
LRQKAALQYEELLQSTTFSTCTVPTGYKHVRHIFAIRANKRKEVAEIFSQFGIGWGIHYPVPLHLQPIYRHLNYQPGDLPVCELLGKELLSLPLFPGIQVDEIETVCKVLTGL